MDAVVPTDFFNFSRNIACDFLQSVTIVDDQALFPGENDSGDKPAKLKSPVEKRTHVFGRQKEQETAKIEDTKENTLKEQDLIDDDHTLNAKTVIDKFADNGITCAILRPSDIQRENLTDKVKKLAVKSDILVFDWVLETGDSEGKIATKIITEIVKKDLENTHRLRLIAVYTGEKDLTKIVKTIKDSIQLVLPPELLQQIKIKIKRNFTILIKSIQIAVFTKKGRGDEELRKKNRVLTNDELPDRLIDEFTAMTSGLVSNVALKALSVIRSHTHQILSTFDPAIDPAYLSHRAMLPEPTDSSELIEMLIGAQITAILEEKEVGKVADVYEGYDVIKAWLKRNKVICKNFKAVGQKTEPDKILELINEGIEKIVQKDQNALSVYYGLSKNVHSKGLTAKFSGAAKRNAIKDAENADSKFAILTSIKPANAIKLPKLTFGTLLKKEKIVIKLRKNNRKYPVKSAEYFLCVQPLCDCVRLSEQTGFLFLPLQNVEEHKPFQLILMDNNKYKKVRVINRPNALEIAVFEPSNSLKMVKAYLVNNKPVFQSVKEQYEWIGELKFPHAQKIVNEFASQISRIGLDESEWLRRWSEQAKKS